MKNPRKIIIYSSNNYLVDYKTSSERNSEWRWKVLYYFFESRTKTFLPPFSLICLQFCWLPLYSLFFFPLHIWLAINRLKFRKIQTFLSKFPDEIRICVGVKFIFIPVWRMLIMKNENEFGLKRVGDIDDNVTF